MASNREWLKSLSDAQLDSEIYWTRKLVSFGKHVRHNQRNLDQAIEERKSRKSKPDA